MKAFILCSADFGTYKESLEGLLQLNYHGVTALEVHPVVGIYDIIVVFQVNDTARIGEFVVDFIRKVPGIKRTVPLIEVEPSN